MHKLARAATALVAGALAGCLSPSAIPPAAAPVPDDPVARAAEHCRALDGEQGMECYQEVLLATLGEQGVEAAMAQLERLAGADTVMQREGHVYAHAIGLAAYSPGEEVGHTFRRCTPAFQSGCYHGVIQAYFVERGQQGGVLSAEVVNALCRDYRDGGAERWLLFQCAHGMGHGLVMLFDNHLPRALQGCDLAHSPWEREACYGGAFMENVVHATMPHHTVGRPQAAGAHGHEHADHSAPEIQERFRALDPADPHYPCSILDTRYQTACYQMQTSAVLALSGGDLSAAARMCAAADPEVRATCYSSLGRDVSARTRQNHREAIRLCSQLAAPDRPWCHQGYAKNLVDLTARAEDGLDYCRLLPSGAEKQRCYLAVGEQIWVLTDDARQREALCATAEPPYRDVCRAGAALPTGPVSTPGETG